MHTLSKDESALVVYLIEQSSAWPEDVRVLAQEELEAADALHRKLRSDMTTTPDNSTARAGREQERAFMEAQCNEALEAYERGRRAGAEMQGKEYLPVVSRVYEDGFSSGWRRHKGLNDLMPAAPNSTAQPLAITSAPERIWLDLGFDPREEDAHFSNLADVTWSADNASGNGIEYVRAVPAVQAQAAPDSIGVDWLGLALDLEDRARTVESQTTERAMTAAAQGLRLMGGGAPAAPAVQVGAGDDVNDWFCALPEGRQAVLRDDKWMLARAAFDAGRAAAPASPAPGDAPAPVVLTDDRILKGYRAMLACIEFSGPEGAVERFRKVANAPQEVMEMALCEAHSLVLRPGQLYRFGPVGDCQKCAALNSEALEAYGPPPHIGKPAHTLRAAPVDIGTAPATAPADMAEAYVGAREDLSIWKRRALEAERDLRAERGASSRLVAEINGQTHMGEPAPAVRVPSSFVNAAGILASDKPAAVIRKLDSAFHDAVTFGGTEAAPPAAQQEPSRILYGDEPIDDQSFTPITQATKGTGERNED